mmetsp:Transcript_12021/g.33798  ORF Transcript_12021/g.33798 Transcript_12021/m.33798 type:complete len:205 (-) Transcript_12021:631-1245(-)
MSLPIRALSTISFRAFEGGTQSREITSQVRVSTQRFTTLPSLLPSTRVMICLLITSDRRTWMPTSAWPVRPGGKVCIFLPAVLLPPRTVCRRMGITLPPSLPASSSSSSILCCLPRTPPFPGLPELYARHFTREDELMSPRPWPTLRPRSEVEEDSCLCSRTARGCWAQLQQTGTLLLVEAKLFDASVGLSGFPAVAVEAAAET